MALNTFQLLSAVEFPLNLLIINAKKNLVGKELSSENRKFSLNVSDTFCELFFVKKKKQINFWYVNFINGLLVLVERKDFHPSLMSSEIVEYSEESQVEQ